MRRSLLHPDYVRPEDLPYGPGNPDYEYDAAVQDEIDEAAERCPRLDPLKAWPFPKVG